MIWQFGGVCHRGKIRKLTLHLKWYIAFSAVWMLDLYVPYCPQVLFWLLDVGISMHVVRVLHNLLPELRDVGSILTIYKKNASGNNRPRTVSVDLLCCRCKGNLFVEKLTGYSLQNTQSNFIPQELVNLHEDLLELNNIVHVVKSGWVKDAVMDEINLISANIDSLYVPTATNQNKELPWSEVVKRKK